MEQQGWIQGILVLDASTYADEATRGPSLLGAAPGVCSSPAKAELRVSVVQQHKRAAARSDLRAEFLSGAGCASVLLLDDGEMEALLKNNSNKRN